MPRTKFQRGFFTCIGVFFMATTMAIFNKSLVMGRFSGELFRQAGISFLEKAPLAFVPQFFLVQPFAGGRPPNIPRRTRFFPASAHGVYGACHAPRHVSVRQLHQHDPFPLEFWTDAGIGGHPNAHQLDLRLLRTGVDFGAAEPARLPSDFPGKTTAGGIKSKCFSPISPASGPFSVIHSDRAGALSAFSSGEGGRARREVG